MLAARNYRKQDAYHENFLRAVAEREKNERNQPRRKKWSSERSAANRKLLEKVVTFNAKLSEESLINVAGVLKKWQSYCKIVNLGDWERMLVEIRPAIAMDFCRFICEDCKITASSSLHLYFRQLQQLYTRHAGIFMDRNVANSVRQHIDINLVPEYGLRPPNVNGKPVVSVAELRVILTFNMAYDTTVFPGERHRLQLAACYLIQCYTGARPAELVKAERKRPKGTSKEKLFTSMAIMASKDSTDDSSDDTSSSSENPFPAARITRGRPKALCYEDINMMLVRHPTTGRVLPAMSIRFTHHKGSDNKLKPTTFFFTATNKLLFCSVSIIMALALDDGAFAAENITDAASVLKLGIPAGKSSQPLRWKASKLKIPVFRKFERNGQLSEEEAMLYSKYSFDLGNQSENAGFEIRWTSKVFRRGASNAANGNAPDPVRDQMMRHNPGSTTFSGAYLNEQVNFDLQNTFLEEETEDELYKLFAHVSLTRDPRAHRDMIPQHIWDRLAPDPEITKLEQERAILKRGQHRIQGSDDEVQIRILTEDIRRMRTQREAKIVKQFRQDYFYNKPTQDIEQQAGGGMDEEYPSPEVDLEIIERARLAEALCNQPDDMTFDEITELRLKAIDFMMALCARRETVKRNRIRQRAKATTAVQIDPLKQESEQRDYPLLMDPRECPDCIGDERLVEAQRRFRYSRPEVRNNHFEKHHLEERETAERRRDGIQCKHPECKEEKFKTVDHFRAHVSTVHGVQLRTSESVRKKRHADDRNRQMRSSKKHRGS
ncbi:FluG domain-containing protein [Truncatella angustata]|uniref:FluG domain-containing protein n=1 Tax=Truncatella angustata TaxID=152316 RepID=A0A9P8ZY56_9PEZI|nr:FluG domain-containing protein [Truncatella angustata]KAH6653689.1 FluG domain-containing protein [Truncatella angustata]